MGCGFQKRGVWLVTQRLLTTISKSATYTGSQLICLALTALPVPLCVTMASEASARATMEFFGLTEKEWNKEITSEHLEEISRSYCRQWKRLIPYLMMSDTTEDDVNDHPGSPREKRRIFLRTWKQMKGSEATYERLVSALLKIECRNDAESVCQLLLQNPPPSPLQDKREVMPQKVYIFDVILCLFSGCRSCAIGLWHTTEWWGGHRDTGSI